MLYDGTCAVGNLPYRYPEQLEQLGIQCHMFAPLRPLVSTHYNNRDHRKILVVDGRVAFTGGINLADEYINRKVLHGHWKDTGVLLRGGRVAGVWRQKLQKTSVAVEMTLFEPADAAARERLEAEAAQYAAFRGVSLRACTFRAEA